MSMAIEAAEIADESQRSVPAEDRESEERLSSEITALWSAQKENQAVVKRTRAELKGLRRNLGERLYTMKKLLARTGRGGQWASYLKAHRIPRTSADRWAGEHEERLNPAPTNGPIGAITEPTEADVKQFFQRLLPRLQSTLTTCDATFYFVREMFFELSTANGNMTRSGIEIFGPSQKGEVNSHDRH